MSANPQPRPFVTGDLDLLISRSLDGDLPGEEERELQSLIAADPAARARYEAMACLVGRLEALPDPETPFALSIRVNSQLEDDTRGLAASLHRFGFYFRPATIGVVVFGIVAVAISYTVISPQKPVATVAVATERSEKSEKSEKSRAQLAPAPVDDGRVNVYFAPSAKKADAGLAAVPAAPAAPARSAAAPAQNGAGEAKGNVRQEPVLVASAESPRKKEDAVAFAPERDAQALAAVPAPPSAGASRAVADESAAEGVALQKAATSETARLRAAAPQPAGVPFTAASAQVVGKAAGTLRFSTPVRLDGLTGPFEGSYRLELDGSGRVTDVVRLFGGSGSEPSGLPARLKELSFAPVEAARTAGAVDVKVRLP